MKEFSFNHRIGCITPDPSIGANHTMAGNEKGEKIASADIADSSGCPRASNGLSDLFI
jgi:hypothetical protein